MTRADARSILAEIRRFGGREFTAGDIAHLVPDGTPPTTLTSAMTRAGIVTSRSLKDVQAYRFRPDVIAQFGRQNRT
ncbi:hypothetical protein LZ190_21875 [Rhodovulum sulfidophilum]|nr:hypothetical protein [Rhodovulum sulfidophilum]